MSELDDFRNGFLPRLIEAGGALHRGDVEPRLKLWSQRDPVTLFGAMGMSESGWDTLSQTFRYVASRFSRGTDFRFEILAADALGDMAYTVAFESCTVSTDGGPPQPQKLRVTQVYRREGSEWKVVHRHGEAVTADARQRLQPT